MCGEIGTRRLPVLLNRDGDHPLPLHTPAGVLKLDKLQAQRRGSACPKGFQSRQPPATRGPRVRDRAEFRADAEPAVMGLAWGEATVLTSSPALQARGFPSLRGCSPLSVPPNPHWCFPCGCFERAGNLLSKNKHRREHRLQWRRGGEASSLT